jgi:hypothetical protein
MTPVEQEAALWWAIWDANTSHATTRKVLKPASANDLMPPDRLETLAAICTTQYINLTRRGDTGPSTPSDSAPAALTPATTTKAQREAATASGGPARGDPVDTTAERETFLCAMCKKVKYWEPRGSAKGKRPWPGATCFDCYKAGRTA